MGFLGEDYESALAEYMKDVPMGISSSFAEDCFREQWEREHNFEGIRPKGQSLGGAPLSKEAHDRLCDAVSSATKCSSAEIPTPLIHTLVLTRDDLKDEYKNTPLEDLPRVGCLRPMPMAYLFAASLTILIDGDRAKILKSRSLQPGAILPAGEALKLLHGMYYNLPIVKGMNAAKASTFIIPYLSAKIHKLYAMLFTEDKS